MTDKPQIKYADLAKCVLHESATVYVVEHPGSTTRNAWRRTSPVQRFIRHTYGGPVFETANSIYLPCQDEVPGEPHKVHVHKLKQVLA
jgi:hypothetical protein